MAAIDGDLSGSVDSKPKGLALKTKFGYGIGDFSQGLYSVLTGLFLNAFLLDVAGLRPALVGLIFLISLMWDSVTDPLVGTLSDRTRARWGRRRTWMLFGAIPFGLSYILLWINPGFGETGTFIYFLVAALFWKTAFTSVSVPYSALTPELTRDYDEQTSLNSYRFRFSILGSLIGAGLHPFIVGAAPDVELGYIWSALTWAFFMVASIWISFATTYEHPPRDDDSSEELGVIGNLKVALANRPYVLVVGLYFLGWLTLQFIQNYLLLYLRYWAGAEGLLSVLFFALQGTAFLMLGLWVTLGKRFKWLDKKRIYYIGAGVWLVTQFCIFFIQPGQTVPLFIVATFAGFGISAVAYLVPWSMLPDVIDYGEWKTGVRREGIYYGLFIFLQKLGVGISIAVANAGLDAVGYLNPRDFGELATQPDSVLLTLRLLVSWVPMVSLILAIPLVVAYPITRQKLADIQKELAERNAPTTADDSNASE